MALLDNVQLPDNSEATAVKKYLLAQDAKDFSNAADFFAENVAFNGLILKTEGRAQVAQEMEGFIKTAIESIEIEAIAEVERSADTVRYMALYAFKLKPAPAPQMLCDHITLQSGKITRIDNVFDVRKVPM